MTFANIFFLLLIYIPLIMLWVFALSDLAHRKDISGIAKGLWAVAIVLLPVIGMLVYFIARPHDGTAVEDPDVVPGITAPIQITDDHIAELEKLAKLKENGAITDEEFSALKAKVLS
jgi:hypothetical protein